MFDDGIDYKGIYWWAERIENNNKKLKT